MKLPKLARIRQKFETNPIADIPRAVHSELVRIRVQDAIAAGERVAITVGSRGIANLPEVVGALVEHLRSIGAKPFIVPAMGSHGGATAEGQVALLAHLGVTEAAVGAPIRAAMDTVQVGTTDGGIRVFLDRHAASADRIVVLNRVKPHTDFKDQLESGLFKMMAIGLGKQHGADYYHNLIVRQGHYAVFSAVGREVLRCCPIAFGLALVENQRDETEIIAAMPVTQIEAVEKQLLVKAKQMLPKIPIDPIDLLVVDWMGKEISGTGMDQNVIGRSVIPYHRPDKDIHIMRIFVRDLTAHSGGNATAIGNADLTTRRLVDKIDLDATYMNAITSSSPEAVRIPPYFNTDRQAIAAALNTIGEVDPAEARIVHIHSTLKLEEFYVSESMLADVRQREDIEVVGAPRPFAFDEEGNLISDLS